MPQVVNEFSTKYPQAELFIETSHSVNLVQQLQDGMLDLSFTAVFPHLIREAQILLRLHDHIVAAVPDNHPLSVRESLLVEDLWHYRMVLPRWGEAFEAYLKSLRDLATDPKPMVRVPLAAALPMSQQSQTITFMPSQVAEAAGLHTLTVPDFSFGWDMVLVTRLGRTLTHLEKGFVETVKKASGRMDLR
jgi:DNA-binding transcriptional LysR family regulator